MILHIPHSSLSIPDDVRASILLSDAELDAERLCMTDHYTDELFYPSVSCARIIAPVSRLVCDVERFPHDADEPMAKEGMGAVYTRTSTGADLRRVQKEERDRVMETYYIPHHASLSRAVASELTDSDTCLIIDCHSFSGTPLPHEPDQTVPRPQICLGTDAFHTPDHVLQTAETFFRDHGLSVAINTPFAGALVPLEYYRTMPGVHSLMIECNRSLYMDERTGQKHEVFERLKKVLDDVLFELSKHQD